ncbi:MAG: FtsX-like permease family protein, partial [Clostridia bacterium]|nr:FtsX-like permease family protein [Clostridia bacterium]
LELTDVRRANEVAEAAAKIEGVEEVTNRQDLIRKILSITNAIKHISVWLLIILAAISVFIISNTIKLGMFSRRKEINIMKFVGATDWFIRWPFIIEGMLLGAVGAAVATVIVMIGYSSVFATVQEFMGNIKLLEASEIINVVIIGFLVMGIGIGMAGSAMSIRKHLHV